MTSRSVGDVRATVGVIVIGDEVLCGRVTDANAAFLLGALAEIGAEVREVVFVPDDVDRIAAAVTRLKGECQLVITTGGIGPTHDDVTVAGVAQALGVDVVEHPEVLAALARTGGINEGRRRLARAPAGAELLWGATIRWPVVRADNVWLFPGVPDFVRRLFADLRDHLPASPPRVRRTLELVAEESSICVTLDAMVTRHPRVQIGSYPYRESGVWRLKLIFEANEAAFAEAARDEAAELFADLLTRGAPSKG